MLALALTVSGQAGAATVTVNVTGVRMNAGRVIASICTKKQFMASPCSYSKGAPARMGVVTVVFENVAPGRYMAAAFQDLDGDGELRFTVTGPSEPAGVSGPKRPIPDFAKAAFDVGADSKAIDVKIK